MRIEKGLFPQKLEFMQLELVLWLRKMWLLLY